MYDAAVIGGGIMGCATALHLARGGMRVVLLERRGLCMAASGVNAGTLSIQIKKAALVPYSIRGAELWRRSPEWLGMDVGFQAPGGLMVAFTPAEAELLETLVGQRRAAGAPIEIVGPNRARRIEPALSDRVVLASHCRLDGYADSYRVGQGFGAALPKAGVEVREGTTVEHLGRDGPGFTVGAGDATLKAARIVLASNSRIDRMAGWFGVRFPPFLTRVNQVVVTERMRRVFHAVMTVANGRLTLKQVANGTVLMGGGWQGIGDLERGGVEIIPEMLVANVRLARAVIPALAGARVMRAWLGVDSRLPDFRPLLGPLPGVADVHVIAAFGAGFTTGPYFGWLLAQTILGREPELPLFDPARLVAGGAPRPLAVDDRL